MLQDRTIQYNTINTIQYNNVTHNNTHHTKYVTYNTQDNPLYAKLQKNSRTHILPY